MFSVYKAASVSLQINVNHVDNHDTYENFIYIFQCSTENSFPNSSFSRTEIIRACIKRNTLRSSRNQSTILLTKMMYQTWKGHIRTALKSSGKSRTHDEDSQILCWPLMGNLTRSSCGLVQMKTNGESDSPSGYCSRYSSCPSTSNKSTQPRRQPVGRSEGKLIRSTESCKRIIDFYDRIIKYFNQIWTTLFKTGRSDLDWAKTVQRLTDGHWWWRKIYEITIFLLKAFQLIRGYSQTNL